MVDPNLDESIKKIQNVQSGQKACGAYLSETTVLKPLVKPYDSAKKMFDLAPYISHSLQVLRKWGIQSANYQSLDMIEKLDASNRSAIQFLSFLADNIPNCVNLRHENLKKTAPDITVVPDLFTQLLLKAKDETSASGNAFSYAQSPLELAQSTSTAASATKSLGLAIGAGLPPQGIKGGEAAINLLRNATGNVQAKERFPLIVGFSTRVPQKNQGGETDTKSPQGKKLGGGQYEETAPESRRVNTLGEGQEGKTVAESLQGKSLEGGQASKGTETVRDTGKPQFGWVFGPKIFINPENNRLELQHALTVHDVSADVSVPGWWPRLNLSLFTAWVGNWHGQAVIDGDDRSLESVNYTINLPLNPPSLESLTDLVTGHTIGPWGHRESITVIDQVVPERVSACQKDVTFIIEGSALWRNTEVYWGGIRSMNVTVLPNMRGITATFNLNDLVAENTFPDLEKAWENLPLTVTSRDGSATQSIPVYAKRTGEKRACKIKGSSLSTAVPQIQSVSPKEIQVCSSQKVKELNFLIEGENLQDFFSPEATYVLLGTKKGTVSFLGEAQEGEEAESDFQSDIDPKVLVATFKGPFHFKGEFQDLSISVGTPKGLDAAPIKLVPCGP